MSGSGGSGRGGARGGGGGGGAGGGGGGPKGPDCASLIFRTSLNSPKPAVVKKLKKDDELDVKKKGVRGPVVAVTDAGDEAGSITTRLARLLECIAEGYKYVAIVIAVSKGNVEVEVRPRSK